MNAPSWLFFALVFWVLTTVWCVSLEPTVPELVPQSMADVLPTEGSGGLKDPSYVTATIINPAKLKAMAENVLRALIFDYAIFDNDNVVMQILRILCVVFTVASLWFIAELFIQGARVAWSLLGKF